VCGLWRGHHTEKEVSFMFREETPEEREEYFSIVLANMENPPYVDEN
jgi:hypothetical protein